MLINDYVTTCQLPDISTLQRARAITYSVSYETEDTSIIKVTETGQASEEAAEFKCLSSFRECVGLIDFLKENRICPEHCKDISSDLGYRILSIA